MHVKIASVVLAVLLGQDQPVEKLQGMVRVPGGVTDAAGSVIYLSVPEGGIVAVSGDKGDVLWEYKDATKPLALVGRRLAVLAPEKGQANVFRVAVLDVDEKGRRVKLSDPVTLPQWAIVDNGMDHQGEGRSFDTRARPGREEVQVRWSAGRSYYGGANPPLEMLEQSRKSAAGIARVHLDSGKVEQLPDDVSFPVDGPTAVDALPKEVQELARRERWQLGVVVGGRGYGQVQESRPDPSGSPSSTSVYFIQAIDLETGVVLWKRPFAQKHFLPPPP